jgi:hypothetical protein
MRKVRIRKPESDWEVVQNERWRLVSDETWYAAEQNRKSRQRPSFGHGPKRKAYALSGLFICGLCGNAVAGHWQQNRDGSNRYYYYRCRASMYGDKSCANCSKIRGRELESSLINEIESCLFSEKFLEEVVKEIVDQQNKLESSRPQFDVLQKRQEQLSNEIRKLTEMSLKVPDVSIIAEEIAKRNRELQNITSALQKTKSSPEPINLRTLMSQVRDRTGKTIDLIKTTDDVAELRLELSRWIENLRLDPDGTVWVKWKAESVYKLIHLQPIESPEFKNLRCLDRWNRLGSPESVAGE